MPEPTAEDVKLAVNERYSAIAKEMLARSELARSEQDAATSCCGPSAPPVEQAFIDRLYTEEELGDLPEDVLVSLGCGNPTAVAELKAGEVVLDLGSGGGLDCFLAGRKVGPTGRVVGLDMSADMVQLARRNARKVGARNVEFRLGEMEAMPFPDASFDVIISNCVINLSPDKEAVFRESFRVLKPGGRFRVSDIVWLRDPSEKERADLAACAGCIAGALTEADFVAGLRAAGFIDVLSSHVPDEGRGFTSSTITATRPPA